VRRCSLRLGAWVVASLTAACLPLGLAAATATQPSEARTARYLESVRANPGPLLAFLREMPKGADLHTHLWGAVYAESLIQWAADTEDCVDPKTLVLVAPPCKGMSNVVPASNTLADPVLYRNMVDAYSMRNWQLSGQSGHDHFFDSFDKFAAIANVSTGKMLAETASRAASQHVPYQEVMHTFTGDAFRDMVQKTPWTDDLVQMQKLLAKNGMDGAVAEARKLADAAEAQKGELLKCGSAGADAGCEVPQRYLSQVLRGVPKNVVFAQMLLGFELAGSDPRFVGINLVQPEDYYVPMHDFSVHMRMLQYLHGVYPNVHIALHAGELAKGMVAPEGMEFHIRDSIDVGHAERIGHGVDVMSETRPQQLMQEMAERGVMVEICLTSNDSILGVKGREHPLRQYMRAGVPVALATDDEGVSRSDMTLEYVKAVQEQGLTYAELKTMARTSLEHAFVPGESLWGNARTFVMVKECALDRPGVKDASARCQAMLDGSEKAQMQWELEVQFRDFETRAWPVTPAGEPRRAAAN
jgi:adenosine deaminase